MTATETIETAPPLSEDEGIWPPEPEPVWERLRQRLAGRVTVEGAITFAIVALCVLWTFKELHPSLIFKNTTPAGGDMGAHVWLPDYVKRGLLSHLRVTGWTPDWYDGFPALTYYFPLPIIAIAVLSYVLPYGVAFKLVTVAGLLTLPVAVWAFARLARVRFPLPACLAAASLPFLFSRDFTIYGGNIASTMAGEFSFSISLSFAMLFLGLMIRGLDTGRHRVITPIILACTGLCHVLPLIFASAGALVLVGMSLVETRDWTRLQWAVPTVVTGGLLVSFWALPFYLRLPYATNMGYQKLNTYVSSLTHHDMWLLVLAVLGFGVSLARGNRLGIFLGFMAAFSAFVFFVAPPARLWNARALPFWFLCLYLLAGVAFSEVGSMIVESVTGPRPHSDPAAWAIPMVTMLAAGVWVLYPLHDLPFGHNTTAGKYDWLGIKSADTSFIPDWADWNYSGYESPKKGRRTEYFALVDKMKALGKDPANGCGRAMWQYEPELDQMGTPDALMLLPFWTHGCIGSQEGLYYESSATTPYHFLNAAELSDQPSNPVRGLTYPSGPNVAEGVSHLQMLGVKYFMAETPDIEAAADSSSNLQLVASVGPFSVTYTGSSAGGSGVQQRTWKIYKVLDADLVSPLINQPVVMKGVQSKDPALWLQASQSWYLDQNRWNVYEAASGPKQWARVSPSQNRLPVTPEPDVQVSNIKQGNQSITFTVDQPGVPVLVKVSYFPNWHVTGAKGPWRVTPNLMVVVPTSNHVTLEYGYTAVDWMGFLLTLLGVGGLVAFWRMGPVLYPEPFPRRRRVVTWAVVGENGKVPGRMADLAYLDRIFKAYDIRGIVPEEMNTDLARAVGGAFARFAGSPRVLVARDMRPSGADLVAAFAAGATEAGADVIDLGLCSTDEMYFASGSMEAPGAMFTASHNPAQYNGIKLCRAGAKPVGADTGLQEIKRAVAAELGGAEPIYAPAAAGAPVPGSGSPRMGQVMRTDVLADYATKCRSFIDRAALKPLKVIADTANGMGGLVVPAVFDGLPFDLEILFPELDGTFPNHPADPIQPENLVALQRRILETGADVGLAFDGDADRCFLVDDRGVPLSGSTTTALVAAAMLDKHPGATILHNLICSKAVSEIVKEMGGVPVRTRVGHSYIKAVMADTDALFGGEHSGHYYFRDNFRADSGTIAALVVLEVLSRSGQPLSEIRKKFERYAASGEINTEVDDDPLAVIEKVAAHYTDARQDRLDGLTVDFGDWWFNLRPSNTEPLLRLNLEAPDAAACRARTAEVLGLFARPRANGAGAASVTSEGGAPHGA